MSPDDPNTWGPSPSAMQAVLNYLDAGAKPDFWEVKGCVQLDTDYGRLIVQQRTYDAALMWRMRHAVQPESPGAD